MIISTICKLLLAMGVGYYLNKKRIFTEEVSQKLSYFVVNVAMPLMIVTALNSTEVSDKGELLRYILAGACFYLAIPLLAKGINLLTKVPKEERSAYEAFYLFSNNMFMGYPVAASLYGSGCIFQLSMFNLGFNLLYYTYGIKLFQSGKDKEKEKFDYKKVLGPGTIAAIIAIVLFFSGLKLPEAATEVCSFLGNVSSPLSMVIIGSTIGTYSLKSIFSDDKRLYFVSIIRLVLMPAATYFILSALGFTGVLRGTATVAMGMPVASLVSMGCIEHQNNEKLGSAGVVLTTIVSLFTIPVMLIFLG